jgi:hypothetical protein
MPEVQVQDANPDTDCHHEDLTDLVSTFIDEGPAPMNAMFCVLRGYRPVPTIESHVRTAVLKTIGTRAAQTA